MAKVYKGAFSGTLPITVSGTGTGVLASYKIFGNTEQAGTPTPENPIVPSECGERTENLCDENNINQGYYAYADGQYVNIGTWVNTYYIAIKGGTEYTVKFKTIYDTSRWYGFVWYDKNKQYISTTNTQDNPSGCELTAISPANASFCVFNICSRSVTDVLSRPDVIYVMLNSGSTALPYEPYGYKLPLTVNGVEYPIYLGDAQLAKDEYVDSTTGKIYRRTKNLSPPEEEWMDEWIWGDGTIHPSTEIKTSPFIDVSTCETCIMEVFSTETEWAAAGYRAMAFYDESKQYLGWIGGGGGQTLTPNSTERWSEFPAGTVYVRIGCSHGDQPFYPQLVSGYTPTHQFYPYLVPTDPPAPLPEIPTFVGTTIIDYAGEGLAPSQFDGVAGWGNLPVKKLNGVPYTGALPAVLTGTKAGYLHRYKIFGNMEQAGTPTPENPIVPSECGERTENLLTDTGANSGYLDSDGVVYSPHDNLMYTDYIEIPTETEYLTQSFIMVLEQMNAPSMCFYDSTKNFISGENFGRANPKTFEVPQGAKYLRTCYRSVYKNIMLNLGSTALPYEPYGYKLPLTSAGQSVDIYLGESQTTRRIKKLVLTGEETWYFFNLGEVVWQFYTNNIISGLASSSCMSNIAEYGVTGNTRVDYDYGAYLVSSGRGVAFQMRGSKDTFVDVDAWKVYLAQQYAAGTPVTVWYILAEPETGIINEPLMKIGDYADTIESEQTTAQIPTTANSTTISWADEGLAPSQFDSIQEWVDKQTYTRVNGEWVADN